MNLSGLTAPVAAYLSIDEPTALIIVAALFCLSILILWGIARLIFSSDTSSNEIPSVMDNHLHHPSAEPDGAVFTELPEELEEESSIEEVQKEESIAPISVEPKKADPIPLAPVVESLDQRLSKTKRGFFDRIRSVFSSGAKLNEETLEELRYALIGSDIGVKTVTKLMDDLTASLKRGEEVGEEVLVSRLQAQLLSILGDDTQVAINTVQPGMTQPYILMMVGVNGVGKTTTCAKLAKKCVDRGLKVLLVAADTFRAAAVEQIKTWGDRLNVPVVSGTENAKPQSVVFDAMIRAKQEQFDVIIIDTAGRLHTKTSLMQELEGINNAISRHMDRGADDVFLVVDGSTGQNALNQAREFNEAVKLTGLVVTKLDGTPKGGIVIAIKDELSIPVQFIGVGESADDLRVFHPTEFVHAILSRSETDTYTHTEDTPSAHAATRRRRRANG